MRMYKGTSLKQALFFLLTVLPSALTAQDRPFWSRALGGAVIGRPVAQVESVVAATDGGNLKSYSSRGTVLWNYYAGGRLVPFTARSREGTSYICGTNGVLIAVNRAGRELWRKLLDGAIVSPVLTGWDGRLFVFTKGKLTCLTAAGYTLWTRSTGAETPAIPAADMAGGVIAVTGDGRVKRFDAFGNVFSWPPEASPPLPAVPLAAVPADIPGWGHAILLLYKDRHLELVYPDLGYAESLEGILDLPSPPLGAAGASVLRGEEGRDRAAVLMENGKVALVSLSERRVLWTAEGHIESGEAAELVRAGGGAFALIHDERGVYVLTKNGASGFAPDGRRLWVARLRGAAAVPAFGEDGILYSGGTDWILNAYRLEDRVRAKQRVLYGEKAEGSYGTGNPGPSSYADYHFRFEEREVEARLAAIQKAVRNGETGAEEKEYTAWLMETAGSAVEGAAARGAPSVSVSHRARAAGLLALIGSRETIPFLAGLFTRERDPSVKAAAAEAIGKIGVDPEGTALAVFTEAVFPPSAVTDEAVLAAIAGAAGALCRFSGPPLSGAGIRILTVLAGSEKPPIVRTRARREIDSL